MFVDAFSTGCRIIERQMAEEFCLQQKLPFQDDAISHLDWTSSSLLRLQAIMSLLLPLCDNPAMASTGRLFELLLDNMVHQVSLCIGNDQERRSFVEGYRCDFRKQYVLANQVQAPWIAQGACSSSRLVTMYAQSGHVTPRLVSKAHQVRRGLLVKPKLREQLF